MVRSLIPISALLLSDALLLLGHGLLLTLLPVAANQLGFTAVEVALTGSAYFLGIIGGCLATPHVLQRVGHIRGFAVLALAQPSEPGASAPVLLVRSRRVQRLQYRPDARRDR